MDELIRVVLVDDDVRLRRFGRALLATEPDIEVVADVGDGASAIRAVRELRPDVVLMDVLMPGACGDIVTEQLRREFPELRVLAWTASDADEVVTRMVRAGAAGFVLKDGDISGIADAIRRVAAGGSVLGDQAVPMIFSELHRLYNEAASAYRATVEALAEAVELRDEYTGGHIRRVTRYATALANVVDPALTTESATFGYLLHDVGKLAIPDTILLKPTYLTSQEFEIVKTHTTAGAAYVEHIPFLQQSGTLVRSHHERWDGSGYPDALVGGNIPLAARIFSLADTLDAITTDRPYRPAQSLDAAVDEITSCGGTQFDPELVDVLRMQVRTDDAFALLREEGAIEPECVRPGALAS